MEDPFKDGQEAVVHVAIFRQGPASVELRHRIWDKLYTDRILGNEFYPRKYCIAWPFFAFNFLFNIFHNVQCNTDDKIVYFDVALISYNLRIKPPVLPPFMSNGPKLSSQNSTTKQQKVKLKQTVYVHSKI